MSGEWAWGAFWYGLGVGYLSVAFGVFVWWLAGRVLK